MSRSFSYFYLLLLKLSIEKDSYLEFFCSKIKFRFIDVILGEDVKLVVGTAGWRQKYGVTQEGPIDSKSIENLVQSAKTNGIEWIDTASSYGDAEEIIGDLKSTLKVATKISFKGTSQSDLLKELRESEKNLKTSPLNLLFIHDWDLLGKKERHSASNLLDSLTNSGEILAWGISSYSTATLLSLSQFTNSPIRFQINCNILDQRLLQFLDQFSEPRNLINGGEFWIRSIFLQGLLLNPNSSLRQGSHKDLRNIFSYCEFHDIKPITLALSFIKTNRYCDKIVIGVNNCEQLGQILTAYRQNFELSNWTEFASKDVLLIDPRKWH